MPVSEIHESSFDARFDQLKEKRSQRSRYINDANRPRVEDLDDFEIENVIDIDDDNYLDQGCSLKIFISGKS